MGRIVTFDPGACTGWAVFKDTECLGAGIVYELRQLTLTTSTTLVIIEKPLIYSLDSKGDPNDLIKLAIRAGELGGYAKNLDIPIQYVTPRKWKGTTPKHISHRRILAKLSDTETQRLPKLPKSKAHNMLDAVGIGLWWLEKGGLRP